MMRLIELNFKKNISGVMKQKDQILYIVLVFLITICTSSTNLIGSCRLRGEKR